MTIALEQKNRDFEISEYIEGFCIGKIVSITENGQIFVDFPENKQEPLSAQFTHSVKMQIQKKMLSQGQKVLLAFENNSSRSPIIIDTLYSEVEETQSFSLDAGEPKDVRIDGERLTFDAKEEIMLRCGKASIILTKAGKVIIRGTYLLNRSSGANRIKGASVQIN